MWKDGQTTTRTLSYAYDAASQLTEASDPAAAYDYIYDNIGRLTEVASDTAALDVVLSQEFDAASRRTALGAEVDSTGDLEDRFYYDNLGRLTKIERDSAPEIRVDFAYNAAGQFTSIKRYKDLDGGASNLVVETSYAYDQIGRLTGLTHFEDTTTFADYDWTYDAFSRVTQFSFSHLVGGSGTAEYSYDNTSQVTAADHSNQTDETYTYDAAGNRTVSGYTTGTNNRLTSDGTFDFTYDDEGNRVTMTRISSAQADDKTTEYTYDYRNRLTKVVEKNNSGTITQQIEYVYDIWDRRIEKSFDADGAGSGSAVVTRWAYDGQNILLTVDATGLVTHRYVYGPDGQILADDYIGAEKYFPLADNLGTVRDIIDQDGDVRNHIVYDSFGHVTSETTSSFDFHFGYTGFERDEETGLSHSDTRYYDVVHGRWTQEDWDVFRGADYNLSRYVGNKVTNFIDPNGREEEPADYSPSVDTYLDRLDLNGPTRRGNSVDYAGQRIRGQIHAGKIEIALYEELANQLENLVWELTGAGAGLCGAVVVEVVEKGWVFTKKYLRVRHGTDVYDFDISDEYNEIRKANDLPEDEVASAIASGADDAIKARARARVVPIPNWKQSVPDSQVLPRNLGIEPGSGMAAHHIVPGAHRRAKAARDILDSFQIDINCADNGVALVNGSGAPKNVLPRHHYGGGLHSFAGIDAVTDRLRAAIDGLADWETARQAVMDELAAIRREILSGDFPP